MNKESKTQIHEIQKNLPEISMEITKNLKQEKVYKYKRGSNNSNLRIVNMSPGDRKVAGCFNFYYDFWRIN